MGIDPVVLFFVFGLLAGLVKSELKLPPALYDTLSIVLLLAIGLHGGVELAEQASAALLGQSLLVLLLGIVLPVIAFGLLRGLRFDRINAAAVAAHYGSVSAGTFAVVVAYLAAREVFFESYMPLFVAILEIPAILVGILLAKGVSKDTDWKELGREIFLGKSIMLLLGGLVIGVVAGKEAIKPLEPLYTSMFKPVLAFFLLEMGLIASGQLGSLRRYGIKLAAFALLMPLLGALIGALLARFMGLSLGGTAMLATLAASASYIAVPAAMRLAVPEANPSLSLTASLGITFPFNILIGIPLYLALAEQLIAWAHRDLRGRTGTQAGRRPAGARRARLDPVGRTRQRQPRRAQRRLGYRRQHPSGGHLQPRDRRAHRRAPRTALLRELRHGLLPGRGRSAAPGEVLNGL